MSIIDESYFWEFLCQRFDRCNNYIIPLSFKIGSIHTLIFFASEAYLTAELDLTRLEERHMLCKYRLTIDNLSEENFEGDLMDDEFRSEKYMIFIYFRTF